MTRTILIAFVALAMSQPLAACSVPVFRYALENWEPDRLTVAIIHDGPMTDEQSALTKQLEAAAYENEQLVNLRLHPIDVSIDHPENSAESWYANKWKDKSLPQMLIYFSNDAPEPQLAWSAPFNAENVQQLLESPARTEVVERLLDGQSAVWILLKSGNKEDDERAEQELKRELARKPDEIELPSLTDLATEEKFNEELGVEMRVEFSVISIDPENESEKFFREMLLNTESDLRDFDDPIAIPIYGRGRTYFALVGPGITADNIDDNCNFICGACSCEVKRDNPGQDLLLAANWNRVQPGNWVNDTPLPELTGIGGFAALDDSGSGDDLASSTEDSSTTHSTNAELENVTANYADEDDPATNETLVASHSTTEGSSAHGGSIEAEQHGGAVDAAASGLDEMPPASTPVGMVVLGWAMGLLLLGITFTIWQRRNNAE